MQERGPPWPKAAAAAAGERHRWHRQSFVEIYATKSNVAMRLIAPCGRIEASQAARCDGGQRLSCWLTPSVKLHRAVGRCRRDENVVQACRCARHDARERARWNATGVCGAAQVAAFTVCGRRRRAAGREGGADTAFHRSGFRFLRVDSGGVAAGFGVIFHAKKPLN
jgi:hypothetical protein